MQQKEPWLKFYGDVPDSIEYPEVTMYEAVMKTAMEKPDAVAYDFMGREETYGQFAKEIDRFANILSHLGLKKGDRITISMPTAPQGIICFYAVNKLGGVASMIHPLSTESEIEFYISVSKSRFALTLDVFYEKFRNVLDKTCLELLILTKIPDYLPFFKGIGFKLTKGRQIPKVPADPRVRWWKDLMKLSFPDVPKADINPHDLAVILYSGGTTGRPKGIMLSNFNFIAEGQQSAIWSGRDPGDSVLAILPIFHGYGLGVCVNAALMGGGKAILVPTFTPEIVAELIKKKRPAAIVGVPTLFEALSRNPVFQKTDLSCLKTAYCGADTLPRVIKEQFEEIVKKQGGNVKLLEGYGLTEAVTGIMATPADGYREGSIGVPFPDMKAKIVKPNTIEEVPCGEEGEICIAGPAVMLGYLDQEEETAKTLQVHEDGCTWLHTGDIGTRDEDGYFYFKLRKKRMIKSSGMNVYPTQVEERLYQHPGIANACVIGVPDKSQGQRVKAFVVLKDKTKAGPDMEKQLIAHCSEELIKWSCPREIEFRNDLPLTLVGKVAYKVLEDEEIEKRKKAGLYTG